jgi:hypothetical protein
MDYPRQFSVQARARVEARRQNARRDLDRYRNQPETRPLRQNTGPYGTLWTDDEKDLHEYTLTVFLAFALEMCALECRWWSVDSIRKTALTFLREFTIEAYAEKGRDDTGRQLRTMTSDSGEILAEIQREFERSAQWHQFEDALSAEAERQALSPPSLPGACQSRFEKNKVKAQLNFVIGGGSFALDPQSVNGSLLIQSVFFAFCAEVRNACEYHSWSLAWALHAVDTAWPAICDFYLLRGALSAEAKSVFRADLWKAITNNPEWTQHLSKLSSLAGGSTVGAVANADCVGDGVSMAEVAVTIISDRDQSESTKDNSDVATSTHPELQDDGAGTDRRAAIDSFISNMRDKGRNITRKNIWMAAGYKDETEFERFQRGARRATKRATQKFIDILRMSPEDFIRLLDKR